MIKQIVDFFRDEEERGSATIEVFMLVEDPQKYVESLLMVMRLGRSSRGSHKTSFCL